MIRATRTTEQSPRGPLLIPACRGNGAYGAVAQLRQGSEPRPLKAGLKRP